MKKTLRTLTLMVTTGPLAACLHAQEQPEEHANWFSFGPQFGLNLNASFNNVGNVNSGSPGPATGGGVNRNYTDGYVRVDSAGNTGGQTWNWGYQKASQVAGNTLTLHSVTGTGGGSLNQDADPQGGFDFAFGRDFGQVAGGTWGWLGAFDFTKVSIQNNQTLVGSGTLISDAYNLGAVIPPTAPYNGSFNGPGPLLGDTPTRTTTFEALTVTGQRKLDAQVFALRTGPYYEFAFSKRWSGRLSGGLALAVADLDYSFNETVTIATGPTINHTGSTSGAEFQAGGFVEGRLQYAVNPRLSFFAGAQFEYLGTFSKSAGGEQAQLDMSSAVNVLFGVQWRF